MPRKKKEVRVKAHERRIGKTLLKWGKLEVKDPLAKTVKVRAHYRSKPKKRKK